MPIRRGRRDKSTDGGGDHGLSSARQNGEWQRTTVGGGASSEIVAAGIERGTKGRGDDLQVTDLRLDLGQFRRRLVPATHPLIDCADGVPGR